MMTRLAEFCRSKPVRLSAWVRAERRSSRYSVIRLLPGVSLPLFIGLLAAIILASVLPIILIFATGFLTDSAIGTVTAGFGSAAGKRAILAIAIISLAFVGTQAAGQFVSALATSLGARLDESLQRRVIRAVNGPVGMRHLDEPATQDAIAQVAGMGVSAYTPGGAVTGMASRAAQTLQSLTAAAILAGYRWWVAALIFGIQVVWSRQRRKSYVQRARVMTQQSALIRRSDYYRELALTAEPAKELQLFGLAAWLSDNFRREWSSAMRKIWEQRHAGRFFPTIIVMTAVALNMLGYAMLGDDALHGAIGLGLLVIYLRSLFTIATIGPAGRQDLQIEYGMAGITALPELEERSAPAGSGDTITRQQIVSLPPSCAGVRFRKVSFTYPGTAVPALDGLDLELTAGESTAIVGANGAGKTTLIKLLCRMYEPDRGSITIGDTSLATIDPRTWRQQIAAIFQDFIHYEFTVRDNISFGALERAGDHEAIKRAAERAGIFSRIESLPGKWDTLLAPHLKDGVELSGGEWQRIALARALFAVDGGARILIMDEPTASLDVRAEADFYDRFLDLTRGLTTVVISHRFSTVRQASRICVLDHGRVIELGSHEELLAHNGRYAHMFTLQSARFTGDVAV
jgi:ATP-binding cassette, subfamily B, bacterial